MTTVRLLLVATTALACSRPTAAFYPYRVRDIDVTPGSSKPAGGFAYGGAVYIQASANPTGETWKTDGTRDGTQVFIERVDGLGGVHTPSTYAFAEMGGLLYLGTNPGLWQSDGTVSGTSAVHESLSFADLSDIVELDGVLYMNPSHWWKGQELWRSDGTSGGTSLVADIQLGSGSSRPLELLTAANRLYFTADDGVSGRELWRSDGTAAGTILVADIAPSPSTTGPQGLVALAAEVCFRADDGVHGVELWCSDGSAAGTRMVADICPGPCSGVAYSPLFVYRNQLWFRADAATNDAELWHSDGTTAGTAMLLDITPGGRSNATPLGVVDDTLFFRVGHVSSGNQLWRTDGTAAGTWIIRDLASEGSAEIYTATPFGSTLLFSGPSNLGRSLWRSDGSAAGTYQVATTGPGSQVVDPQNLVVAGTHVYFSGTTDPLGSELWRSDGTDAGTELVRDLNPATSFAIIGSMVTDGTTAFLGTDDTLWRSDGTTAGTVPVYAVAPQGQMAVLGSTLYFVNREPPWDVELWQSSAGVTGEALDLYIPGSSEPRDLTVSGGRLYFSADNGVVGRELWSYDGINPRLVLDLQVQQDGLPEELTPFNGGLLLSADRGANRELWITDGTPSGTAMLDVCAGGCSSNPTEITVTGTQALFAAYDPFGVELFRSDGTAAGTSRVLDICPGQCSSRPRELAAAGPLVYFQADDGASGYELWVSDGTGQGTLLLADICPGSCDGQFNSYPPKDRLAARGSSLFFAAGEPATGYELWFTDGTPSGTALVADICPGACSSDPSGFLVADGILYFRASDSVHGSELWRSDGTAAGTHLVRDIRSGGQGSYPWRLTRVGDRVLFVANDGLTGSELWAFSLMSAAAPLLRNANVLQIDPMTPARSTLLPLTVGRDLYLPGFVASNPDPDADVLGDATRPLVFYQLDASATLKMVKESGRVRIDF